MEKGYPPKIFKYTLQAISCWKGAPNSEQTKKNESKKETFVQQNNSKHIFNRLYEHGMTSVESSILLGNMTKKQQIKHT